MPIFKWQKGLFILLGLLATAVAGALYMARQGAPWPLPSAAAFVSSFDRFEVDSPLVLMETPRLVLERATVQIAPGQNRDPGAAERILNVLGIAGARVLLDGAVLTLHLPGAPGLAQASVSASTAPDLVQEALTALAFDSLSLRRATISIHTASGPVEVLDNVSADVTQKRKMMLAASGSLDLRGERLAFETAVVTSTWKGPGSKLPFSGSLRGQTLSASVSDGRLVVDRLPRLAGSSAEISIPDLRRAARWLGMTLPAASGASRLAAKGQLDWNGATISLEKSAFVLDKNEATGALSLSWGGERPQVEGTLALHELDLSAAAAAAIAEPIGGKTLDLSLLRHTDADLRISADSIKIAPWTLGRSAIAVSNTAGKLLADVAEVEMDPSARATGQLMVDATGPAPKLSLRAKIEQYDLAAPTALVLGHGALLLGLGTIAVDLSSSGSSFDQLAAQLAGKVVVGLPAGGKVAADVPALAALAAGTRPEVGWASLGRGSSSLDRFDAKLTVAGRQVAVDSIKARSGALSLAGSGKLDLTNQTLDARLGIWRGELPAASQAQPPVPTLHISGPWQSPLVRPVDRTSKAEAAPMPAMGAAQKPATAR